MELSSGWQPLIQTVCGNKIFQRRKCEAMSKEMRADFHSGACFINVQYVYLKPTTGGCLLYAYFWQLLFILREEVSCESFYFLARQLFEFPFCNTACKMLSSICCIQKDCEEGAEVCALREIFQDDISTGSWLYNSHGLLIKSLLRFSPSGPLKRSSLQPRQPDPFRPCKRFSSLCCGNNRWNASSSSPLWNAFLCLPLAPLSLSSLFFFTPMLWKVSEKND